MSSDDDRRVYGVPPQEAANRVGMVWRASSQAPAGTSIEVAVARDGIVIRHAAVPRGPRIALTDQEWNAFLQAVKAGEFD